MKRTFFIGLLVLCLLSATDTFYKAGDNSVEAWEEQTVLSDQEYIWRMETQKELKSFNADRSGAIFELNSEVVFEGQHSCKVIPGGGEETKLALKITKILDKWNGKSYLFLNLYLPEDSSLNSCFLGLALTLPDWKWVDGCMAATPLESGQWNKVLFQLTDKMKFLNQRKQYVIYLCFWSDQGGVKVPMRKKDSFYIDGIGLIQ